MFAHDGWFALRVDVVVALGVHLPFTNVLSMIKDGSLFDVRIVALTVIEEGFLFIVNVLPFSGSKGIIPFFAVEVRQVIYVCFHGLEVVIKYHMVLGCDLSSAQVEYPCCHG